MARPLFLGGGRARLAAAAAFATLWGGATLSGCAAREGRARLDPAAARELAGLFRASAPTRLQAVQSVIMSWRHRPLTALGWLRYDREARTFALVGMSPTGATLFSLSETGGEASGSFAAPPGGDPEAWTAAMAEDVRRIYFDGVPGPEDDLRAIRRGVVARRRLADGVELALTLREGPLRCEADWWRGGRRIGTTKYLDYEAHGRLRVPRRIVHRNRVYGYELVIRLQEIQLLSPGAETEGCGGTTQ